MILNGENIIIKHVMNTSERKQLSENPKYKIGDIIDINSEHVAIPGIKNLNKGKYVIINFRDSYVSSILYYKVYDFKLLRKNSKYTFCFSQEWVEANSNKAL